MVVIHFCLIYVVSVLAHSLHLNFPIVSKISELAMTLFKLIYNKYVNVYSPAYVFHHNGKFLNFHKALLNLHEKVASLTSFQTILQ